MPKTSIENALFRKPGVRERVEALAADPGCSVQELQRWLRRAGVQVSRSAAARWLHNFRRAEVGTHATLLAAVIRRATELDSDELRTLAKRLRRQKRKR